MRLDASLRQTHRVAAALFLLAVPPAWYFSMNGDPAAPHPAVYLPLLPLLLLALTGTYQLVAPWLRRRARSST